MTPIIQNKKKEYTIQQLNEYIALTSHFTDKPLKEIAMDKEAQDWYRSELEKTIKVLGIDGKLTDLTFQGIKIV